ncbi:hypothetical protein FM114_12905 [Luteococcus japonicus LSP_Lj1]|uniref:Uncharacterized protein n=1 Tax=Luteococcus japonicus LSP_Lj1 TaxID=1255658 RepID=A0A1R4KBF9_9ACTN|nr:hypothetical protein FM114_12905 [Luteococcus japonicus LSP_Lj1]
MWGCHRMVTSRWGADTVRVGAAPPQLPEFGPLGARGVSSSS